jgi:hypothetical protein
MISIELNQCEDLILILRETNPDIDITLSTYVGGIGKGENFYDFVFTPQPDKSIEILLDNSVTQDIPEGSYYGEIFQITGTTQLSIAKLHVRVLKTLSPVRV